MFARWTLNVLTLTKWKRRRRSNLSKREREKEGTKNQWCTFSHRRIVNNDECVGHSYIWYALVMALNRNSEVNKGWQHTRASKLQCAFWPYVNIFVSCLRLYWRCASTVAVVAVVVTFVYTFYTVKYGYSSRAQHMHHTQFEAACSYFILSRVCNRQRIGDHIRGLVTIHFLGAHGDFAYKWLCAYLRLFFYFTFLHLVFHRFCNCFSPFSPRFFCGGSPAFQMIFTILVANVIYERIDDTKHIFSLCISNISHISNVSCIFLLNLSRTNAIVRNSRLSIQYRMVIVSSRIGLCVFSSTAIVYDVRCLLKCNRSLLIVIKLKSCWCA